MNWEAIAAVGEMIGATAVVVSLIYLAVQIRQNTRQVYEQTRSHHLASLSAVGQGFLEFRASISRNQQTASVWVRGNEDLSCLGDEERQQFDYLAVEFFWSLAMMWLYVQQGVFERELFDHSRKNIPVYAGPGLREWWQTFPNQRVGSGFESLAAHFRESLKDSASPVQSRSLLDQDVGAGWGVEDGSCPQSWSSTS
ncbi:hypothetical protein ACFL5A_02720 [Gemmatimonadota bacterium]